MTLLGNSILWLPPLWVPTRRTHQSSCTSLTRLPEAKLFRKTYKGACPSKKKQKTLEIHQASQRGHILLLLEDLWRTLRRSVISRSRCQDDVSGNFWKHPPLRRRLRDLHPAYFHTLLAPVTHKRPHLFVARVVSLVVLKLYSFVTFH